MRAPADKTFQLSGGKVYAGQVAPDTTPLWAVGAPLNSFIDIPGTDQTIGATNWAGPSGNVAPAWFEAWGAMTLAPSGSTPRAKLIVAAQGGHTDGYDNRVAAVDLMANVPGWITETPPSATHRDNQPYETDGKPESRHGYAACHWSESLQRVVLVGLYGSPGTGNYHYPTMDGWNPVSKAWDPIGAYPYTMRPTDTYAGPDGSGVWPEPTGVAILQGDMMDTNGDIWQMWAGSGPWRYSVSGRTWTAPAVTRVNGATVGVRFPWAEDTLRNQMFGMQFGDSQGASLELGVYATVMKGTTLTKITFNSGAALTQFAAEAPGYPGMDYDPIRDKFLLYAGYSTAAGVIYEITPNNTTVWDIDVFAYAPGATQAKASPPTGTGICNRFRYVPVLKGFILLTTKTNNIQFMRTA